MPNSGRMRRQRERFWNDNPHCRQCGALTWLPESGLAMKANDRERDVNVMATIEHTISRWDPRRGREPGKHLLLCHRCNQKNAERDTELARNGALGWTPAHQGIKKNWLTQSKGFGTTPSRKENKMIKVSLFRVGDTVLFKGFANAKGGLVSAAANGPDTFAGVIFKAKRTEGYRLRLLNRTEVQGHLFSDDELTLDISCGGRSGLQIRTVKERVARAEEAVARAKFFDDSQALEAARESRVAANMYLSSLLGQWS